MIVEEASAPEGIKSDSSITKMSLEGIRETMGKPGTGKTEEGKTKVFIGRFDRAGRNIDFAGKFDIFLADAENFTFSEKQQGLAVCEEKAKCLF